MTEAVPAAPPKFFYGWVIVAIGFLLQGLASGLTQYLIGIFAVPLGAEFNEPRATVLLATSSMMAGAGCIFGPVFGYLLQRVSARRLVSFAVAWMAAGFIAFSQASGIWQIGLVYALFFSAASSIISVGTYTVAAQWFVRRRGRAFGFVIAGTSVFGFIMPPLATLWVGDYGWRQTCMILAGILMAATPLVFWLFIDKPEDKGLSPDGVVGAADSAASAAASADSATWTAGDVLRSSRFWVVAISVSLCQAIAVANMTNLFPAAVDAGIGAQQAAILVSIVAGIAAAGKILFGIYSDFMSQRNMIWLPAFFLLAAAGLLYGGSSYGFFLAASVMVGAGLGSITPAWGTLVGLNFGRAGFSLAQGFTTTAVSLVMVVTVPLIGRVRDVTASYDAAWLLMGGLLLVPAAVAVLLPARRADQIDK